MPKSAITVRGIRDIDRTLRTLPKKVGRRALLNGLRKAIKPLVAEMQRLAPREHGDLAKSIAARTARAVRGSLDAAMRAGPTGKEASLAHLQEFGVRPHTIKAKRGKMLRLRDGTLTKKVEHPGHPAQPFMRPAFDALADQMAQVVGRDVGASVERAARREAKKQRMPK